MRYITWDPQPIKNELVFEDDEVIAALEAYAKNQGQDLPTGMSVSLGGFVLGQDTGDAPRSLLRLLWATKPTRAVKTRLCGRREADSA